jgi:tetratricopeptide (TPR) repeat protein
LAGGGVHPEVLLFASPLLLVASFLLSRVNQDVSVPVPALILAALSAYTLLQVLPLPLGLLSRLSPEAADVWTRALHPLAESPTWGSLSLDPGATAIEALKYFVYANALFVGHRVTLRYGQEVAAAAPFLASLLVAVVTLGHRLFGVEALFGLYRPIYAGSLSHAAPLLNPNNLAGYLNLGAFCGLGLVLSSRVRQWKAPLLVGVATILGTSVLTGSRGGVWVLPVGLVLLSVLVARSSSEHTLPTRWLLLLGGGGGLLLGALGATQVTWHQLLDEQMEKVRIVRAAADVARDYPGFGSGRGALGSVFAAYWTPTANELPSHAENWLVQGLAEWGVAATLLALALAGWCLRPRRIDVRSSVGAGVAAGIVVVLIQNLADLGTEVPALALSLAWSCAVLLPERVRPVTRALPRRGTSLAVALAGAGLCVLGAVSGRQDVIRDRRALSELALRSSARTWPELRAELRGAMLRHPADPFFARLGAAVALSTHAADPMPWLQRALERGLHVPRTHFLVARVMFARGARTQALLELRLASEGDADLARSAGALAAVWSRDSAELEQAAPAGRNGAVLLVSAGSVLDESARFDEAEFCYRKALSRDPDYASARVALTRFLVSSLQASRCAQREACAREVALQARALRKDPARLGESVALEVSALRSERRFEDAERLLAENCPKLEGEQRSHCLGEEFRTVLANPERSHERLAGLVRDYAVALCASGDCAAELRGAADELIAAGEREEAVTLLERAAAVEPSFPVLLALADAAIATENWSRARSALARASRLSADGPREHSQVQERMRTVADHVAREGAVSDQ